MTENKFMQTALDLARQSALEGEVPVGAVIVKDGEIVGTGRNRREYGKNALYHAEIEAIDSACKKLGGWRLWQCEMYVTLEPCPMCASAIKQSRISRIYYGVESSNANNHRIFEMICKNKDNNSSIEYNPNSGRVCKVTFKEISR